jgi:hypothetical protein
MRGPEMKLKITFATKYNGISVDVDRNNSDNDGLDLTSEMELAFEEVSNILPEYTYEWANNWEHELSDEHIAKLIKMTADILRPTFPDITIDDITFEYDHLSS